MKYDIILPIHTNSQFSQNLLPKFICFPINFVEVFLSADFYYFICPLLVKQVRVGIAKVNIAFPWSYSLKKKAFASFREMNQVT